MDFPSVARARLPGNYTAALEALRVCAKGFSPERYAVATVALRRCLERDECADWPQDENTMASYARVAEDSRLERLCRRVEKARRAWLAQQT